MNSAKLNDWMQVIGIFALVASLIFVGFQMKQTQDIAIASQYQARAEVTMNLFLSSLESGYVPVQSLRSQITTLAWIIHEFQKMAIVRAFSASERRLYSVVTSQTSKSG